MMEVGVQVGHEHKQISPSLLMVTHSTQVQDIIGQLQSLKFWVMRVGTQSC